MLAGKRRKGRWSKKNGRNSEEMNKEARLLPQIWEEARKTRERRRGSEGDGENEEKGRRRTKEMVIW